MRHRLIIFIVFISLLTGGSLQAANLDITDIRCQHTEVPYGVDTRTPVFSWELGSDTGGAGQSAYQIIVSDSEKKISKGVGDMWDSGKVMSSESLGVVYAGKPLESGKRYYWKVRVWDNKGSKTKWSDPGFLQMGLLEQNDWNGAEWIALETAGADDLIVPGYQHAGN